MKEYGLIGFPLSHSFSQKYFTEKFRANAITDCRYELFELSNINLFPELIRSRPLLQGINVTIPYKQAIIPFLDDLETVAAGIGAVNVIKLANGKLKGFNSDYQGFMQSLQNFFPSTTQSQALVLGTGGAAKAVTAALQHLNINYKQVSRNPTVGQLSYEQLTAEELQQYLLIINTTPLGTYPQIDTAPPILYEALTDQHYLYDLVYNPAETIFLKNGKAAGAKIKNGYEMLVLQAEVAWQIWNS
ncbi:shikimate dehydrogenase family protein [Adhaeribacter pallidiroseus]|uniref:Shikimate dehydrogenase n=1 Tax=Adhaeribacter pallidiroseus TaxID=2072847 RepID=A0A369QJA6_9BACT|nr:shikimate dehydrogenase [Adhaeribacter pallidiroseus]RDC64991.1 Shikimate dehydrogenase [Adhaeribacter pallidiroseus]